LKAARDASIRLLSDEIAMNQDSHPHDTNHSVRRIVLPSGREIEVISFGADTDTRDIHLCPHCDCDLVQPVSWSEAEDGRWELALHCPNCEWLEASTYTRTQVENLEERMDEGLTAMITDLHRLTQANMAADIDRFVAALQADVILPEDF
jgi:hypothetical protein